MLETRILVLVSEMPLKQRSNPNLAYASPRTSQQDALADTSYAVAHRGTAPMFGSQEHRILMVEMCANMCKNDLKLRDRFINICGLTEIETDSSTRNYAAELAEKTADLRLLFSLLARLHNFE